MRTINYGRAEFKRVEDGALPYYIYKASYIIVNCFRSVDLEALLNELRKEVSSTGKVSKTIDPVLRDDYQNGGYLRYDIDSFFLSMLQRYQVRQLLEGFINLDIYVDFKPDKNFRRFHNEPDYLKNDYRFLL